MRQVGRLTAVSVRTRRVPYSVERGVAWRGGTGLPCQCQGVGPVGPSSHRDTGASMAASGPVWFGPPLEVGTEMESQSRGRGGGRGEGRRPVLVATSRLALPCGPQPHLLKEERRGVGEERGACSPCPANQGAARRAGRGGAARGLVGRAGAGPGGADGALGRRQS